MGADFEVKNAKSHAYSCGLNMLLIDDKLEKRPVSSPRPTFGMRVVPADIWRLFAPETKPKETRYTIKELQNSFPLREAASIHAATTNPILSK
jgi:hypothetical protein